MIEWLLNKLGVVIAPEWESEEEDVKKNEC